MKVELRSYYVSRLFSLYVYGYSSVVYNSTFINNLIFYCRHLSRISLTTMVLPRGFLPAISSRCRLEPLGISYRSLKKCERDSVFQ
jgi:hypothetical protein